MGRRTACRFALGIVLLTGIATTGTLAAAQTAPKADAPAPAGQQSKQRSVQEIMQDFQATGGDLRQVLTPSSLLNPAKREEASAKALPVLRKMMGLLDEVKQTSDPQGKMIAEQAGPEIQTFLVVFGDKETESQLRKQAAGPDKDLALKAKGSLLTADWMKSSKDEAAQQKLADEAEALARENPKDEYLTGVLAQMSQLGAATPKLAERVQDAAGAMNTRTAQGIKEQAAADKKLRGMEDKPLVIAGVRNDGSQFSSANWKGKVILVDFWATWCGPCRAELPRVKKAYADFHDKGLEVLGVSCDNDANDLSQFLQQNKDMPWPQLFDAKTPGWHQLAKDYGIMGIPTMFLIDKKGVVRTVTARENFEEMIPKLLAE